MKHDKTCCLCGSDEPEDGNRALCRDCVIKSSRATPVKDGEEVVEAMTRASTLVAEVMSHHCPISGVFYQCKDDNCWFGYECDCGIHADAVEWKRWALTQSKQPCVSRDPDTPGRKAQHEQGGSIMVYEVAVVAKRVGTNGEVTDESVIGGKVHIVSARGTYSAAFLVGRQLSGAEIPADAQLNVSVREFSGSR